MPSLLSQAEDAIVTLLTPLLQQAIGGDAGGYLEAVELYQGDLTPEIDDPELNDVLQGRSPAVLVSTGDSGEYANESVSLDVATESAEVVLLIVSKNDRSRAAQARGDGYSSDPGAYEILNDVRARLQGQDSGVAGAGRFRPVSWSSVQRGAGKAIRSLTMSIQLDALPYEGSVDSYDTLRQSINEPDDTEANPVAQGDTDVS